MPFHQPDTLRYYTFEILDDARVKHAVFTRRGGVSPPPWESLNHGGTVGDDLARVTENRRRAFSALGMRSESIYDVWQVHSAEVICTDRPRVQGAPYVKADAILTAQPGIGLFMRFADCVPVLIFDPFRRVVGLVHAGWMGTVKKVVDAAVRMMHIKYGSCPSEMLAAIGPSIGPDHYVIGQDVEIEVQAAFGEDAKTLLHKSGYAVQFDLWEANRLILEQAGIRQIEVARICTACHLDDWYSHRGEHGKTGRFGVIIGM